LLFLLGAIQNPQLENNGCPEFSITLIALACSVPTFCGEFRDVAKAGDLAEVKSLPKDNPDLISRKDDFGYTPLHWAAMYGCKDVAELLLTKGAEVNAKDEDGETPLHWAARHGHKDVVELLRRHGGQK
jgi:ankyrin repeat protein